MLETCVEVVRGGGELVPGGGVWSDIAVDRAGCDPLRGSGGAYA